MNFFLLFFPHLAVYILRFSALWTCIFSFLFLSFPLFYSLHLYSTPPLSLLFFPSFFSTTPLHPSSSSPSDSEEFQPDEAEDALAVQRSQVTRLHTIYSWPHIVHSWLQTVHSYTYSLSRSQLQAKFFNFLDKNRLIFAVLSGRFQRLERDFGILI